jgi:hypothetical protein
MISIANPAKEIAMANQQKDDSMSRSDTTAPGGAQPVRQQSEAGKTGSEVAGKVGGTDAAAGAQMAGGTGLGEAASADDARVGTSTGQGADLTGGDAGSGDIPPPTDKGGASAA